VLNEQLSQVKGVFKNKAIKQTATEIRKAI